MLKASRTERYYFAGTVLDGEAIIIVNLQCDIVRIAADVAEKLRSISFNFCFQFVTIGGDTIGKQLMECCTDFNFFHCEIQICIRCAGFPNFFFKACQGYVCLFYFILCCLDALLEIVNLRVALSQALCIFFCSNGKVPYISIAANLVSQIFELAFCIVNLYQEIGQLIFINFQNLGIRSILHTFQRCLPNLKNSHAFGFFGRQSAKFSRFFFESFF